MALGALQSRVERAVKDLDSDDDDDRDYAGHHEPSVRHRMELTSAIRARDVAPSSQEPRVAAPDAIPIVASLAGCAADARASSPRPKGRPGGYEPARHRPRGGVPRRRKRFKVACDAMHGERAGGHALADGMRALALDPRRLFRPASRAIVRAPDHSGCCKGSGPSTTFCRCGSRQTTRRARRATG